MLNDHAVAQVSLWMQAHTCALLLAAAAAAARQGVHARRACWLSILGMSAASATERTSKVTIAARRLPARTVCSCGTQVARWREVVIDIAVAISGRELRNRRFRRLSFLHAVAGMLLTGRAA